MQAACAQPVNDTDPTTVIDTTTEPARQDPDPSLATIHTIRRELAVALYHAAQLARRDRAGQPVTGPEAQELRLKLELLRDAAGELETTAYLGQQERAPETILVSCAQCGAQYEWLPGIHCGDCNVSRHTAHEVW
jgi:hypothetical protein